MKASVYDRMLIGLTLLAPLFLLALSQWRASLETLYAPAGLSDQFMEHVSAWLATGNQTGSRLIVIVDRDCPCTQASLRILESARGNVQLSVRDIDDVDPLIRNELPSTPTLLAVAGKQLVYAGPVTSGDLCTTAVQRVLGVTALQAPRERPMLNAFDSGCYCRVPRPKP